MTFWKKLCYSFCTALFLLFLAACDSQPQATTSHDDAPQPTKIIEQDINIEEEGIIDKNVNEEGVIEQDGKAEEDKLEQAIGKMAYNVPEQLKVGKAELIEVKITKDNKLNITDNFNAEGEIIETNIEVTNRLQLKLTTVDDVEVTPLVNEEQGLGNNSVTTWSWKVKAKSAGNKTLVLRVGLQNIDVDNPDLIQYREAEYFEIPVKANVPYSIKAFIGNNWEWLMSAIIIPLVIFLYNRHSKAKKST